MGLIDSLNHGMVNEQVGIRFWMGGYCSAVLDWEHQKDWYYLHAVNHIFGSACFSSLALLIFSSTIRLKM